MSSDFICIIVLIVPELPRLSNDNSRPFVRFVLPAFLLRFPPATASTFRTPSYPVSTFGPIVRSLIHPRASTPSSVLPLVCGVRSHTRIPLNHSLAAFILVPTSCPADHTLRPFSFPQPHPLALTITSDYDHSYNCVPRLLPGPSSSHL